MDPLPLVNKIYSMILKVEKQRLNRIGNTENLEMTTLLAKSHPYSHRVDYISKRSPPFNSRNEASQTLSTIRTPIVRKGMYKKSEEFFQNKEFQHYKQYGMTGHTMANYFKIHGYPDWYKSLKNKKALHEQGINQTTMRENSVGSSLNTPFDCVKD